jgi:poly-beta-1,6-N-acetyl-D-glucosamine biosynthesis protein PgaD
MDKSRPGHPPRLPLIIERPDLAHPFRRVAALLLTVVAWCVWLGMWFVLIATIGRKLGFDLPEIVLPNAVSLKSFEALMYIAPYAIAAAAMAVMLAYLYDRLRTKLGEADTRWRPVGLERLARDAALDPQRIAEWQAMQVLYVEHGPLGRVTDAHAAPPCPEQVR